MDKTTFVEAVKVAGTEAVWEALQKDGTVKDWGKTARLKQREAKAKARRQKWSDFVFWLGETAPAWFVFFVVVVFFGCVIYLTNSDYRDREKAEQYREKAEQFCQRGDVNGCVRGYAQSGDEDRKKMLAALYQAKTGQKLPGAD